MTELQAASEKRKIVAVLSDLLFTVKIQEAAKRLGLSVVFVKTREQALAKAGENPAVIIVDLNDEMATPLELIAMLKADDEHRAIPIIGYVSHVQVDLRRAAAEQGCDLVVARSVFVEQLPALLERYR